MRPLPRTPRTALLNVGLASLLALPFIPARVEGVAPTTAVISFRHDNARHVVFPGTGVTVTRTKPLPRRLHKTSKSFRHFLGDHLDQMFAGLGSVPGCEASPNLTLSRYDSSGFAAAGEGFSDLAGACPAGGYGGAAVYVKSGRRWSAPLFTGTSFYCSDLAFFDVPRFIERGGCATEDGGYRDRYSPRTKATSPEATGRRLIDSVSGYRFLRSDQLAASQVITEMARRLGEGAALTRGDCVMAGDGSVPAQYLGDAPRGCVLDAFYAADSYRAVYVMQMQKARHVGWYVARLAPFGDS